MRILDMQATLPRLAQIEKTAARLFRERGFHGTSVRNIADAVGLQGGSLYAHIDGKDDLLWKIADGSADRFFEALTPIVNSNDDVARKLRNAIVAHVGVITADLDAAAVYTTEWRHLAAERRERMAHRRDEYENLFRGLISTGIRAGLLAPVDEGDATLFCLSALNYVFLWYKPDGRMSSDEVATMLAGFIMDGLRRRTT